MLQPQEVVVSKLLPTIRARLAQVLLTEYRFKQVEVARALGVTQAAVSHYNTRSRGTGEELLGLFPEIDAFARELAAEIDKGLSHPEQIAHINDLCGRITGTVRFCEYHKKHTEIDPACNVCFGEPPQP